MTRSGRAVFFVVIAAVAVPLACDDEVERRTRAIYEVRSAVSAEQDEGARTLERLLEKSPRDRYALHALAGYYEQRGRIEEARELYERLVKVAPGTDESDHAKEAIRRLPAPGVPRVAPPPASSSALPPLPPTAIGTNGVGPAKIGSSVASVASALGACEASAKIDDTDVCDFLSRGLEVASKSGTVTRVAVFRDGRELDRGDHPRFRGFEGETSDGVRVGAPIADVTAKLGEPAKRRLPRAASMERDGTTTIALFDYPKKRLTIEVDHTRHGDVVGAIQIPTIEGRPMPASSGGKP